MAQQVWFVFFLIQHLISSELAAKRQKQHKRHNDVNWNCYVYMFLYKYNLDERNPKPLPTYRLHSPLMFMFEIKGMTSKRGTGEAYLCLN